MAKHIAGRKNASTPFVIGPSLNNYKKSKTKEEILLSLALVFINLLFRADINLCALVLR